MSSSEEKHVNFLQMMQLPAFSGPVSLLSDDGEEMHAYAVTSRPVYSDEPAFIEVLAPASGRDDPVLNTFLRMVQILEGREKAYIEVIADDNGWKKYRVIILCTEARFSKMLTDIIARECKRKRDRPRVKYPRMNPRGIREQSAAGTFDLPHDDSVSCSLACAGSAAEFFEEVRKRLRHEYGWEGDVNALRMSNMSEQPVYELEKSFNEEAVRASNYITAVGPRCFCPDAHVYVMIPSNFSSPGIYRATVPDIKAVMPDLVQAYETAVPGDMPIVPVPILFKLTHNDFNRRAPSYRAALDRIYAPDAPAIAELAQSMAAKAAFESSGGDLGDEIARLRRIRDENQPAECPGSAGPYDAARHRMKEAQKRTRAQEAERLLAVHTDDRDLRAELDALFAQRQAARSEEIARGLAECVDIARTPNSDLSNPRRRGMMAIRAVEAYMRDVELAPMFKGVSFQGHRQIMLSLCSEFLMSLTDPRITIMVYYASLSALTVLEGMCSHYLTVGGASIGKSHHSDIARVLLPCYAYAVIASNTVNGIGSQMHELVIFYDEMPVEFSSGERDTDGSQMDGMARMRSWLTSGIVSRALKVQGPNGGPWVSVVSESMARSAIVGAANNADLSDGNALRTRLTVHRTMRPPVRPGRSANRLSTSERSVAPDVQARREKNIRYYHMVHNVVNILTSMQQMGLFPAVRAAHATEYITCIIDEIKSSGGSLDNDARRVSKIVTYAVSVTMAAIAESILSPAIHARDVPLAARIEASLGLAYVTNEVAARAVSMELQPKLVFGDLKNAVAMSFIESGELTPQAIVGDSWRVVRDVVSAPGVIRNIRDHDGIGDNSVGEILKVMRRHPLKGEATTFISACSEDARKYSLINIWGMFAYMVECPDVNMILRQLLRAEGRQLKVSAITGMKIGRLRLYLDVLCVLPVSRKQGAPMICTLDEHTGVVTVNTGIKRKLSTFVSPHDRMKQAVQNASHRRTCERRYVLALRDYRTAMPVTVEARPTDRVHRMTDVIDCTDAQLRALGLDRRPARGVLAMACDFEEADRADLLTGERLPSSGLSWDTCTEHARGAAPHLGVEDKVLLRECMFPLSTSRKRK